MISLCTLLSLTGWEKAPWDLWAGAPSVMQGKDLHCFKLADLRLQVRDLGVPGTHAEYGVWVHTTRSTDVPYFAVVERTADVIKVIGAYSGHSRVLDAA